MLTYKVTTAYNRAKFSPSGFELFIQLKAVKVTLVIYTFVIQRQSNCSSKFTV